MKQRHYITALTMIVALTGLSPVVVADAERPSVAEQGYQSHRDSPNSAEGYKLSAEQMDKVHAGVTARQWAIFQNGIAGCNVVQCYVGWLNALYIAEEGKLAPPDPRD
jgi:hypothetical protein